MSGQINIDWKPPGPVAARFMASTARVQILNGPTGGGKTTACLIKAMVLASRQRVSLGNIVTVNGIQRQMPRTVMVDGFANPLPVRRFKIAVIRDTYRQLWKTTLPSWWKRVPKEVGSWVGAQDGPATHQIIFTLPDHTAVEFTIEFGAIGEHNVEDVMRGYEVTAWLLNEIDLLAEDAYTFARNRWARFPDMSEGGPSWYGILADCNAPELGTWFYEKMFLNKPEDVELFRQPSGFAPNAENLMNLVPGYYLEQAKDQPDWFVQRMLRNKPGFSRSGKPIYPEFNDAAHVVEGPIKAMPGRKLYLGFDAGLDPAMQVTQKLGNGRWRLLRELVTEHGTGARRFSRMVNECLKEHFPDWPPQLIEAYADPSAGAGDDKEDEDDKNWIDLVSHETGLTIRMAPTNNQTTRKEALRRLLELYPDGEPAFQMSSECIVTRAGLNSGYQFKKLEVSGAVRYTDEPVKNKYSHPVEALEYVLLGAGEASEVHDRRQRSGGGNLPRQAEDYNPMPT